MKFFYKLIQVDIILVNLKSIFPGGRRSQRKAKMDHSVAVIF